MVSITKLTNAHYRCAFFIAYNGLMNYDNYIKQTYDIKETLTEQGTAFLLDSEGNQYYVSETNPHYEGISPFESTLAYYANYFNRNYPTSTMIGLFYVDDRESITLFVSNRVDFLIFETRNSNYAVGVQCVDYKASNGNYYPIEDGDWMSDYLNYDNGSGSPLGYNSTSYGNYNITLDTNHSKSVFDFSNLKGDNYKNNSLAIRGENISFYDYGFNITNHVDFLDVSYGTPYNDMQNNAYNQGYGNGFASGYVQGQDIGFQNGVNSQGTPQAQATAFTYIEGAFRAVSNIMTLEVLPNITLGLAFSIPLVFVLIMTIFKLVRK